MIPHLADTSDAAAKWPESPPKSSNGRSHARVAERPTRMSNPCDALERQLSVSRHSDRPRQLPQVVREALGPLVPIQHSRIQPHLRHASGDRPYD